MTKKNRTPNIAVIGNGYWGKNLVRNFYQLGALKTICDCAKPIREEMSKTYPDMAITTNISDILNDKDITGVVIATPAALHFEIAEKALQALDHGVTPVICVGETADERNSGREVEIVRSQVAKLVSVLQDRLADCLIAYEPVWAIGTGKVASAEVAQDMHRVIRLQLAEFDEDVASHVGILYGGSVKPDNAVELFAMPDIDGGLIGGASLDAESFLKIFNSI